MVVSLVSFSGFFAMIGFSEWVGEESRDLVFFVLLFVKRESGSSALSLSSAHMSVADEGMIPSDCGSIEMGSGTEGSGVGLGCTSDDSGFVCSP